MDSKQKIDSTDTTTPHRRGRHDSLPPPVDAGIYDMTTGEALKKKDVHEVGKSIKKYRERLGMEQQELARRVGVKPNAVSNWENGRTRPDLNLIPKIREVLQISFYELFNVDDPIRNYNEAERQLIADYRYLKAPYKEAVSAVLSTLKERQEAESCRPLTMLPTFKKTLAAGFDIAEDFDDFGEPTYLYSSVMVDSADCVFTVSGDSMEPEYHDGDRVLVRRFPDCGELQPGDVGAFMVGSETYIKEYQEDGLHSYNENYETMHFHAEEHVYLIGRVVGVLDDEDFASDRDIELYFRLHPEEE